MTREPAGGHGTRDTTSEPANHNGVRVRTHTLAVVDSRDELTQSTSGQSDGTSRSSR
jgi:hypothetical protein